MYLHKLILEVYEQQFKDIHFINMESGMSGPYYSASRRTTRNANAVSSGFAPEGKSVGRKYLNGRCFSLTEVTENFFGFCNSIYGLNKSRTFITLYGRPIAELEIRPKDNVKSDVSFLFGAAATTVSHAIRDHVKHGQTVELMRREAFGVVPYAVLRPVANE